MGVGLIFDLVLVLFWVDSGSGFDLDRMLD